MRNLTGAIFGDYRVRCREGTNSEGETIWLLECIRCSRQFTASESWLLGLFSDTLPCRCITESPAYDAPAGGVNRFLVH